MAVQDLNFEFWAFGLSFIVIQVELAICSTVLRPDTDFSQVLGTFVLAIGLQYHLVNL